MNRAFVSENSSKNKERALFGCKGVRFLQIPPLSLKSALLFGLYRALSVLFRPGQRLAR